MFGGRRMNQELKNLIYNCSVEEVQIIIEFVKELCKLAKETLKLEKELQEKIETLFPL